MRKSHQAYGIIKSELELHATIVLLSDGRTFQVSNNWLCGEPKRRELHPDTEIEYSFGVLKLTDEQKRKMERVLIPAPVLERLGQLARM